MLFSFLLGKGQSSFDQDNTKEVIEEFIKMDKHLK